MSEASETSNPLFASAGSTATQEGEGIIPSSQRVTDTRPTETAKTDHRLARLASHKARSKTYAKEEKEADSSDALRAAIRKMGELLTPLSQNDRMAALRKVTGAFGYKSKTGASEARNRDRSASKKQAKKGFNEAYSKTISGSYLEVTKKVMKKATRSKTEKPSEELYELHRTLLQDKHHCVEHKTKLVPVSDDSHEPEREVQLLLDSYRAIKSAYVQENVQPPPPALIFKAGQDLFQGKTAALPDLKAGKIPARETWASAPFTVQRTEQEAEERAAAILAQRARARQARKRVKDPENPASKRARLDEPGAEASAEEAPQKDSQAMEMDA